jgi:hypothetical protein
MRGIVKLPGSFAGLGITAVRRLGDTDRWEILEPIADGFEQRPRLRRTIVALERSLPAPPRKSFERRKLNARPHQYRRSVHTTTEPSLPRLPTPPMPFIKRDCTTIHELGG